MDDAEFVDEGAEEVLGGEDEDVDSVEDAVLLGVLDGGLLVSAGLLEVCDGVAEDVEGALGVGVEELWVAEDVEDAPVEEAAGSDG